MTPPSTLLHEPQLLGQRALHPQNEHRPHQMILVAQHTRHQNFLVFMMAKSLTLSLPNLKRYPPSVKCEGPTLANDPLRSLGERGSVGSFRSDLSLIVSDRDNVKDLPNLHQKSIHPHSHVLQWSSHKMQSQHKLDTQCQCRHSVG